MFPDTELWLNASLAARETQNSPPVMAIVDC